MIFQSNNTALHVTGYRGESGYSKWSGIVLISAINANQSWVRLMLWAGTPGTSEAVQIRVVVWCFVYWVGVKEVN